MKRMLLVALVLTMVTTLALWFVAYAWPAGDCIYSGVCCVEPQICAGGAPVLSRRVVLSPVLLSVLRVLRRLWTALVVRCSRYIS